MSTDFFKKYINIIEEAQQLDELSPDQNIFQPTEGVAEESLDEAGTPDAVRRIEQLVQYK
jgi:hypothetical protein